MESEGIGVRIKGREVEDKGKKKRLLGGREIEVEFEGVLKARVGGEGQKNYKKRGIKWY